MLKSRICSECKIEFKGRPFSISGERGKFRKCPNGHWSKDPVKQKPISQLNQILLEVRRKLPGETSFDAALRYVRNAEKFLEQAEENLKKTLGTDKL